MMDHQDIGDMAGSHQPLHACCATGRALAGGPRDWAVCWETALVNADNSPPEHGADAALLVGAVDRVIVRRGRVGPPAAQLRSCAAVARSLVSVTGTAPWSRVGGSAVSAS